MSDEIHVITPTGTAPIDTIAKGLSLPSSIRGIPPTALKHAEEDRAAKDQRQKLIETRRELRKMLGQA